MVFMFAYLHMKMVKQRAVQEAFGILTNVGFCYLGVSYELLQSYEYAVECYLYYTLLCVIFHSQRV